MQRVIHLSIIFTCFEIKDMAKKVVQPSSNALLIVVVAIILFTLLALILAYLVRSQPTHVTHQKTYAPPPDSCPIGQICLSSHEYKQLVDRPPQALHHPQGTTVRERDMKVVQDPLYPPLNRTDTVNAGVMQENVVARNMYVPTRPSSDTFRLIGYVISKDETKDMGGNTWKLYARDKDRNRGEFYIIPADNNYDIKIPITQDIIRGEKLRDVYSIPSTIQFNSPFLNKTPYDFVELPKTDFTSSQYF
jgi:hypothetical protein